MFKILLCNIIIIICYIGHIGTTPTSPFNPQISANLKNWTIPWFPNEPGQVDKNPLSTIGDVPNKEKTFQPPWFPNKPGTEDVNPQVDLPERDRTAGNKYNLNKSNWSMPWMPSEPGTLDPNPSSKLSTPLDVTRVLPTWFPNAPNKVDQNPSADWSVECDDGLVRSEMCLM